MWLEEKYQMPSFNLHKYITVDYMEGIKVLPNIAKSPQALFHKIAQE